MPAHASAGEVAALQQEGAQLLLQALAAAASYKVDPWEVRMKATEALLLASHEITPEVGGTGWADDGFLVMILCTRVSLRGWGWADDAGLTGMTLTGIALCTCCKSVSCVS